MAGPHSFQTEAQIVVIRHMGKALAIAHRAAVIDHAAQLIMVLDIGIIGHEPGFWFAQQGIAVGFLHVTGPLALGLLAGFDAVLVIFA